MKIEIVNRQRICRVDGKKLGRLASFLLQNAFGQEDIRSWSQISLILTDDAGIAEINNRVFASRDVTDVISSNYDPIPGENSPLAGELTVNVQRAMERTKTKGKRIKARTNRWTAAKELALYIAHGCDHLTGEEDADAAGRARMRRRELRWVDYAEKKGLLDRLIGRAQ